MPYPRNRRRLAKLAGRDERDLWPDVDVIHGPGDVRLVGPHRWAVPREEWIRLFASATREVGILVYSGLFLAEDAGVRAVLADKARAGVRVRILLGDPESANVTQRGTDEGIDHAMAAKIRNALALYRPLRDLDGVEIRLHGTVLYTSIYRADDELLVNLHAYGMGAAQAPVFRVHGDRPTTSPASISTASSASGKTQGPLTFKAPDAPGDRDVLRDPPDEVETFRAYGSAWCDQAANDVTWRPGGRKGRSRKDVTSRRDRPAGPARARLRSAGIRAERGPDRAALLVYKPGASLPIWVFVGYGGRSFSWHSGRRCHPVTDIDGAAKALAAYLRGEEPQVPAR